MAARMYESGPSQEELDLIGITLEDVANQGEQEVWPENWTPFQIFSRLSTQWVVGSGGPIGLNYLVLPVIFKLFDVGKKKQVDVFEALRIMESEALSQMSEKR